MLMSVCEHYIRNLSWEERRWFIGGRWATIRCKTSLWQMRMSWPWWSVGKGEHTGLPSAEEDGELWTRWAVNTGIHAGPPAEAHAQQTSAGCWRQPLGPRGTRKGLQCSGAAPKAWWPPAQRGVRWEQARLGIRESGQKSWPSYGAAVSCQKSFWASPSLYETKNTHLTEFPSRWRITK